MQFRLKTEWGSRLKALLITLLLPLLFIAAEARADEAKKYYRKGIALFDSEQFFEAAKAFRMAYSLKPSWKLYYNIGQAEAAARRYGLALDAFENYLVQGGDNVDVARREIILEEIEGFKLLVGTVEVAAPDGTTLFIDGEIRGTTPFEGAIRVAAGLHTCMLKKGEDVLLERSVRITGGMKTTLKVKDEVKVRKDVPVKVEEPVPVAPPTLTSSPTPSSQHSVDSYRPTFLIAGVLTSAIGVSGIGLGAAYAVKASIEFVDAEKELNEDEFNYKYKNFETSRTIYIVGFAVGGAFLLAGVTLIALDVVHRKRRENNQRVLVHPAFSGLYITF